jgi:subtilase family serine protease
MKDSFLSLQESKKKVFRSRFSILNITRASSKISRKHYYNFEGFASSTLKQSIAAGEKYERLN